MHEEADDTPRGGGVLGVHGIDFSESLPMPGKPVTLEFTIDEIKVEEVQAYISTFDEWAANGLADLAALHSSGRLKDENPSHATNPRPRVWPCKISQALNRTSFFYIPSRAVRVWFKRAYHGRNTRRG